ncbi:hypothetical protein LPJ56_000413 [Coemansia sp. RSA 2599]|nr:hypothetical protein LPJ75_000069 [Coemansia sp. RSA 2598]KAJ1829314.1 hypothetical protein LPJ56_000413 [Coemansia sp. RSA 2599]
MHKNPPETPGQLLDRIAEAHAINCSRYINAIVELITEPHSELSKWSFKPHMMTLAVCSRLLEAICSTEVNGISMRVDWRIAQGLINVSVARRWELDSELLQDVAIYLANSSFYEFSEKVKRINAASLRQPQRGSIWSFHLNSQEICDISLSGLIDQAKTLPPSEDMPKLFDMRIHSQINTAIDIARMLATRSFVPKPAYFLFMIRAMCVCEQKEHAETMFSMAQKFDHRHLGAEYALMMSMYYQIGDYIAADTLFSKFANTWKAQWKRIKNSSVMPDAATKQAEKWRLSHEESVETPLVFDAAELWQIRSRASAPFYQRVVELIRSRNVGRGIRELGEAKYKYAVSLTSMQIGAIIHALLAAGWTEEAISTYVEFQKSANVSGGPGIRAQDVVFGKTPFGHVTGDLLRALGAADDWNHIWSIVGDSTDLAYGLCYVDSVKELLARALDTGNQRHAVRCAELLRRIAALHSTALDTLGPEWLKCVFARAFKSSPEVADGHLHLALELLDALVQKNAANQGNVYLRWNAQAASSFFGILRELLDAARANKLRSSFYTATGLVDALLVDPASQALIDEARFLFNLLPESLVSVPTSFDLVSKSGGWGKKGVDMPFISKDSSFWSSTVKAFLSQSSSKLESKPGSSSCGAYGLLQTIKLGFVSGASIDPALLAHANNALLDRGYPVVDMGTGDLLPRAKQIEAKKRQIADRQWIEAAKAAEKAEGSNGLYAASQSEPSKLEMRLQEKVKLYAEHRRSNKIPSLRELSSVVGDAMRQSKRAIWEPIVRDHMPEYLQLLRCTEEPGATAKRASRVSTEYATAIWSQAIVAYGGLGEADEAIAYFRRIVDAGGYPISQATSMLLSSLSSIDTLLPVLPRGWDGRADRIFGMEPAYPPQPESPGDTILVPKTRRERNAMVAQIGLAMLYATFKNKTWPTAHFYNILLTALGKAGMISELRQVFEVISVNSMRKMPAKLRINPAFAPSPILWAMAIREAAKAGESALSGYWFKEYRMSAMPIFREEASAYSRFAYRDQPKFARLFVLGRPYYLVAQLERPLLEDGSSPVPWYDLGQVEKQLELDRLRALDKLPMSYLDAFRMLTIYALVDEHRNMDSAEALAEEIIALHRDKTVPKYSRPRGATDLASCWRMMVSGYIGLLKYYHRQVESDPSEVKRCKERLVRWYKQWKKERQRSGVHIGIPGHSRMLLSEQDIALAESISASMR